MSIRPIIAAAIAVLAATSCNNDVFVKPTAPSSCEVVLDGDGSRASIKFQPSGLQYIYFDVYGGQSGFTYYDRAGREIAVNSPAKDVARISFSNIAMVAFDVYVDGDELTFECVENTVQTNPMNFSLRLDYGFGMEIVHLTLMPGQPMECTAFSYDTNALNTYEEVARVTDQMTLHNESSLTQVMELWPYLNVFGSVELTPEATWAKGENVQVRIPYFNGTEWTVPETATGLTIYRDYTFTPAGIDWTTRVKVDVPATSTVTAQAVVNYYSVSTQFTATFRAPVSGREFTTKGIMKVTQPFDYEIQVL